MHWNLQKKVPVDFPEKVKKGGKTHEKNDKKLSIMLNKYVSAYSVVRVLPPNC
jgi:hypothetical protein